MSFLSRPLPLAALVALLCGSGALLAQDQGSSKPDYPPVDKVLEGYSEVKSTLGDSPSYFTIYTRGKDDQMLAELPKTYASDKMFIALTVASGERYAGLQAGEHYVYWRKYNNRLALIEPNVQIRSTGDAESRSSVKRLFTDRVLLDVPILTLSKNKRPIIDMDALLVGQATKFFPSARGINPRLASIKTAKSFEKNAELAFEVPMSDGRLKTLHYSISKIPDSTGYKPRVADQRLGYFTTAYSDLGKYKDDETRVRYINRWHLEKADPKLRLSPPKQPIEFYIEHTTPKRYRYWVQQGIEYWNEAFENIGLRNAIVIHQQDADTKRFMEYDPEDVNYNFVRWLNNDIGTAIGPSRVHPLTGQILDADIILTDGWIRYYENQFNDLLPRLAMEGFGPATLSWLNQHPNWDPRILMAAPSERPRLIAESQRAMLQPLGGHPIGNLKTEMLGDDEYDGLIGRHSQTNGMCMAADGKAFELAMLRMSLSMMAADEEGEDSDGDDKDEEEKDEEAEAKEEEVQKLDGVPEDFIGPLIAELVAHEVGHTLGLRHNFKASSIHTLEEITSGKLEGQLAGSVMDYLPINMKMEDGKFKGDHTMTGIGPYDYWVIEYGYTFDEDLSKVLDRVAEPELVYGTDEDTMGPDPRARRYDFSKNPIDYAKQQMELARYHRERLLDNFVKDGESWAKAREGYQITLSLQTRALSMMANWVGGTFLSRDKKGDKDGRVPVEVVPVERQREALDWVLETAFNDEAYGLEPELLLHLASDQWLDSRGFHSSSSVFPIHDRIMGIQSATLTMLMNPDTLQLVYDNEVRTPADKDIVTLPELLDTISAQIWSELEQAPGEKFTARKPWISSLRRNLQREHLQRLFDLTLPSAGFTAAYKPITNLATLKLREVHADIETLLEKSSDNLDPYSLAHLSEAKLRIEKTLDAEFIYNVNDIGGGGSSSFILFGEETESK